MTLFVNGDGTDATEREESWQGTRLWEPAGYISWKSALEISALLNCKLRTSDHEFPHSSF